ncbi:phosphopantothenate/pantothenate synthetase [Methanofollis aquaemaris]|uniref:4-phosphopantoate--beta-alanine ligase n=1 Tax=Methanofollis aquaemaris TaxID=126734 RepID=A0A8A3S471_9EURY|nr:4-phosphopantoate--beta-alanine ligase [Methanofollis aquaemaris]QSZ66713.1 phosphopantothenate/pantothenate synthetase [Methanofollis aquaemaris]
MTEIPKDHPRYAALMVRDRLTKAMWAKLVAPEGLIAQGRGEAFDYLLGEQTTASAARAERTAAAMLLSAERPVISVNGNTAALCAHQLAALQEASGAAVEVNLFHRTEERMEKITALLEEHGVTVLTGTSERLIPLSHDRALCLPDGIGRADLVLVPLEDGDRCEALRRMGKSVITIDLNPLSRTARTATLAVIDEVTRAVPAITAACRTLSEEEARTLAVGVDNRIFLEEALRAMAGRLGEVADALE